MLVSDNRPYHGHGSEASLFTKFMCCGAIGAFFGSGMAVIIARYTSSALAVALLTGGFLGCLLTLFSVLFFVDSVVIRKPNESLSGCKNLELLWEYKNFTKLVINFVIPTAFGVGIGAGVNFMLGAGIATVANAVFPSTMLIKGCSAAFLGSSALQGAAIGTITVVAVLGALWIANNAVDYIAKCLSPTEKVNCNIDEVAINQMRNIQFSENK
ncbi:hypothetical protein [Wolbachia endosymbiont of Folsomia candida]|uniref:hypothetical protein n=1 Tax=Wolbachia endosymbiont of Folsomia candida TaxID=169402 RepID=UPI000A8492CE|nr:hypothetical protein [Wolbachia endosymbiont of Folsomia candida]APR98154.1 hypothetical protein ASM33_02470 [Wolbachia endosymbiont of Folsomia candida]